jgi:hypothetical protein
MGAPAGPRSRFSLKSSKNFIEKDFFAFPEELEP